MHEAFLKYYLHVLIRPEHRRIYTILNTEYEYIMFLQYFMSLCFTPVETFNNLVKILHEKFKNIDETFVIINVQNHKIHTIAY